MNIITAGGHKVRVQSQRRYIVIRDTAERGVIEKRSDNLDTALREARRFGAANVYDNVTGEGLGR
jgi:hypothetical protein